MTSKNKPLSIIDTLTTSNATPPVSRKTTFNPYTGGIISTGTDKPTFGKYTMEIKSGNTFISREVRFKKLYNSRLKRGVML